VTLEAYPAWELVDSNPGQITADAKQSAANEPGGEADEKRPWWKFWG
jgi:hypothetical protein